MTNFSHLRLLNASRRGFTILELLVAAIAIGAATLIAVTAIGTTRASRRETDRVQCAAQEINNLLERLATSKWDELTAERLAEISLPKNVTERIAGAKVSVSMTEITEPRKAKKLTAQFQWPDNRPGLHPPLRLSTWVFAPKETP